MLHGGGKTLVSLLKTGSHSSCPWDMQEFGGIARNASHWAGWTHADGGGGHCFPAGYASSSFTGSYFALRHEWPRLALRRAALAGATGLVLGLAQPWRGAHFMSHTLWTAWLCWMTVWLSEPLFSALHASMRREGMP